MPSLSVKNLFLHFVATGFYFCFFHKQNIDKTFKSCYKGVSLFLEKEKAMPQNDAPYVYNEDLFKSIIDAQRGISPDYDPNDVYGSYSREVERQSAEVLEEYISGECQFTEEAEKLLPEFFETLKSSRYHRIKKSLKKAEAHYKLTLIQRNKQAALAEIAKQEKIARDNQRRAERKEVLRKNQFGILNKKKETDKLSSVDLLLLSAALNEEKSFSTVKMKDKLRSLAMQHIDRVLKGEIPADENFAQLADVFGTYQQRHASQQKGYTAANENNISLSAPVKKNAKTKPTAKEEKKKTTEQPISKKQEKNPVAVITEEKEHKQPETPAVKAEIKAEPVKKAEKEKIAAIQKKKEQKRSSFWRRAWKWTKRAAVVAGLALLGYIGGKTYQHFADRADDGQKQDKTETVVKTQPEVQKKKAAEPKKTEKTADFAKELSALDKAYKNRFDTALKIILGEQERDQLYSQVDKLAKDGKIEYKDGTTREWYAHAFTMYDQLAPNSRENKAIQALLSGQGADKEYINSLVMQAGRDGKGIKASGSYSAFDKAPKELQQQHLKNRKAVKDAEKAAALAKAQNSR